MKRKKPHFVVQDSHKLVRVGTEWRRPRGIDSKMRLQFKGYRKIVKRGYGSPKAVYGLDSSGLKPVIVSTEKELPSIKKEETVIISSKVSQKKKSILLKKIKELQLAVSNIKDIDKYLELVSANMKERKDKKEQRDKKKATKAKEKKAKDKEESKDEKLADKVLGEEEKAAALKKEKDKILTKKE